MSHALTLTLSCPERPGIVRAVSSFLFARGCDIVEHQQFDDPVRRQLFLRTAVACLDDTDATRLAAEFRPVAAEFGTTHQVAGVSNHEDLRPMAEAAGLRFHHVPVTAATKRGAEARLLELVDEHRADLVVLARYMQVLSDETCAALHGRAINIHHSFLPGFKGAKPYHQAFDRGVELVGATAHYVTPDLDEGPIIEQEVIRIDHTRGPRALATVGQDAEALALSRAVRWHCEQRVLLNGSSTVVFR